MEEGEAVKKTGEKEIQEASHNRIAVCATPSLLKPQPVEVKWKLEGSGRWCSDLFTLQWVFS